MTDQESSKTPVARRMGHLPIVISAIVGLGLLALLLSAILLPKSGRSLLGDSAPDFTLVLLDGSQVSLSNLRGQVVVLNFWTSWCYPCREEAPELQKAWKMYEDKGVVFLGVSCRDTEDASRAFITQFGITYASGIDPQGRICRAYNVVSVPVTFVIDRDGKVAWIRLEKVSADALTEQLTQLL